MMAMMTPEEKRATIQRVVGAYVPPGRVYPAPLPDALRDWYCYTVDGGHSILVALPAARERYPDVDVEDVLVPAPVRAVLRAGYTVDAAGYVWCDLPYDDTLGLVTEPEDDEY